MLSDTCSVAHIYELVISTCQGLKQKCPPYFVFIEDNFYCPESNPQIVPEDQRDKVRCAESTLLNNIDFKIGYPYLVRHCTAEEGQLIPLHVTKR